MYWCYSTHALTLACMWYALLYTCGMYLHVDTHVVRMRLYMWHAFTLCMLVHMWYVSMLVCMLCIWHYTCGMYFKTTLHVYVACLLPIHVVRITCGMYIQLHLMYHYTCNMYIPTCGAYSIVHAYMFCPGLQEHVVATPHILMWLSIALHMQPC